MWVCNVEQGCRGFCKGSQSFTGVRYAAGVPQHGAGAAALEPEAQVPAGQAGAGEARLISGGYSALRVWNMLQAYRNTVPVPRHWSQKRKYLQGKRGLEKPAFRLPEFIEATGIGEMRQAYQEKVRMHALFL